LPQVPAIEFKNEYRQEQRDAEDIFAKIKRADRLMMICPFIFTVEALCTSGRDLARPEDETDYC
jgi:hypothetical protein